MKHDQPRKYTKSWANQARELEEMGYLKPAPGERYVIACEDGVLHVERRNTKVAKGTSPATVIDETYKDNIATNFLDYFSSISKHKSVQEIAEEAAEKASRLLGKWCYAIPIRAVWDWPQIVIN